MRSIFTALLALPLVLACSPAETQSRSQRGAPWQEAKKSAAPPAAHATTTAPIEEPPPWQNDAERDADAVFRSLHPELLACYARRLRTHSSAHAYVTLDVLVGEDGRPRDVATTGGALLGAEALECFRRRVQAVSFIPPRGGGTARMRVPFALEPSGWSESPAAD